MLKCAGRFGAEELGIALQRIQGDLTVFAADGEVRTDWLVELERFAGRRCGELRRADRTGERLASGGRLQTAGEFDGAGRNRGVAANAERVGEHRGEAGDVDRTAQLDVAAAGKWKWCAIRLLGGDQTRGIHAPLDGDLADVAFDLQCFDGQARWL